MKTSAQQHPRSITLMTAVMLLIGLTTVFSAEAKRLPRSALPGVQAIDTIERREMPKVDIDALLAEDVERENSGKPVAPRFAKNLPVDYTPDNSGTWETLADGSRLWRPNYSYRKILKRTSGSHRSIMDTVSSESMNPPSTRKGARATSMSFARTAIHGATRSAR